VREYERAAQKKAERLRLESEFSKRDDWEPSTSSTKWWMSMTSPK
jgi:hypothetical protein